MKFHFFFALFGCVLANASSAQTPKSLADAMSKLGVSEKSNTFGHAEERTADNLSGRLFYIDTPDKKTSLWSTLRKTTFVGISSTEPKAPYIFTVLNTGNSSHDRPVEEFWVDSQGIAYFLIDHNAPTRTFMIFKADELGKQLSAFAETYGKRLQ